MSDAEDRELARLARAERRAHQALKSRVQKALRAGRSEAGIAAATGKSRTTVRRWHKEMLTDDGSPAGEDGG